MITYKIIFRTFLQCKYLPFISIFLSLFMLIWLNNDCPVTSFNREIGQALISGVDVASRIRTVMLKAFFFLPLLIFSVYSVIPKFVKIKIALFLSTFKHTNKALFAFTALSLFLLCNLSNGIGFTVFFMIIIISYYIILQSKLLDEVHLRWSLLTSFPMTMFLIELHRLFGENLSAEWIYFLLFFVCYISCFIVLSLSTRHLNEFDKTRIRNASTTLYFAPILISIFLEGSNILNQYNIFIVNKSIYCTVIFIFCILLFFKRFYYKSHIIQDNNKCLQWQYPMLILGIASLAFQPTMQIFPASEFFEASNHGSAIFNLFNFYEIPIVQNLDAHMLSLEVGRILYGLINNDKFGAIFFEYSITPIIYLLFYYFLLKLLNDRFLSLIITLIFPLICFLGHEISYGIGILVWLASLWAYKRQSMVSFIIFYFICVMMFFYRLDVGVSMALSSSFILFAFICLLDNRKQVITRNLFSALIVITLFLFLWIFSCLHFKIPPLSRTIELLDIISSNTRWAYASIIGSFSIGTYIIIYILMPAITTTLITFIFFNKLKTKFDCYFLMYVVFLAYFLNFQRSLVRHGIIEGSYIIFNLILPLSILVFCICCYIITNNSKTIFIFAFSTILLLMQSFSSSTGVMGTSIFKMYTNNALASTAYKVYESKIDRVIISQEMANRYELLKQFFDATLENDETFWDYSHQTLLYALTNRRKPMYTNQSPSFLNGEYSQLMYLKEINSYECTYAVLRSYNDGFDGVPSSVVHYLTSENLYRNYKPLCRVLDYQIWVKNDRYFEKRDKIINLTSKKFQPLIFTDKYVASILLMQTKAINEGNWLRLESIAADPGIAGLENNLKLKDALSEEKGISFEIEYSSSLPDGIFQCFYTLNKDEGFTEENSVTIQTKVEGKLEFYIPSSKYTKLRFDIPDESSFIIKNVAFFIGKHSQDTKGLSKIADNLIDYDCDGQTHTYDIGELPFIWGTYDEAEPQQVLTKVASDGSFGMDSLDLESGNYIEIKTNSVSDGKGVLTVLRKDGTPAILVNFNVHAGENRYLVRISWDSFWYSGQSHLIVFNCDNQIENTSLHVLKGDTNLSKLEKYAFGMFVAHDNSK